MLLQKKLIGLDILRFTMAIVMVLYHLQSMLNIHFLKSLALNGFYATSIFFLLSGFILTHVYQEKIKQKKFSQSTFLFKRFSALYPVHIFTMIIALATLYGLILLNIHELPLKITEQVIPTQNSVNFFYFNLVDILNYITQSLFLLHAWNYELLLLNAASWSVSALFFFYLFFSYFAKKILKTYKIFLWLFITWLLYLTPPLYFTLTQNFSSETIGLIHRNPLFRLPEFILGIIFYKLSIQYLPYLNKFKIQLVLIGILGFLLVGFLVENSPNTWFYLTHNGLFFPTQVALIAGFLFIRIHKKSTTKLIERLGKSSLTIYMIHLPLLAIISMIYKLIYGLLNSKSISEAITIGKNLELLGSDFLIIFLMVLIPLSLYLQDKIFTPLQNQLSNRLIGFNQKRKSKKIKI